MIIDGVSLSVLSNSGTQQPKMDKGIIYVSMMGSQVGEGGKTN